jgi:hypothetical protein
MPDTNHYYLTIFWILIIHVIIQMHFNLRLLKQLYIMPTKVSSTQSNVSLSNYMNGSGRLIMLSWLEPVEDKC